MRLHTRPESDTRHQVRRAGGAAAAAAAAAPAAAAEEPKPLTFGFDTIRIAPLIWRVVRAARAVRVLGAGLGFPVGDLRFSPPTSDIHE